MPVITDKERALIGQESEPRPVGFPINEAMATHWCEMTEDANPIYFDEAYARTTWLQTTFAPPTMLNTWGMTPVWPPVEQRRNPSNQLELEGCDTTIAANSVQEYFLPLRWGDTLTSTSRIDSISDEKRTRLGFGHFVVTVTTFRNQFDQIIGTHTFTLFMYRPHPAGGES